MDLVYRLTHRWAADTTTLEAAEALLVRWSGPWMLALAGLLALAWLPRLPALVRLWREIPAPARLGFLAVFNLAVLLRVLWAPRTPQVFYDEFNFLETARGLAEAGLYLAPETGGTAGRVVPVPPGWPAVLGLAFHAFSPSVPVAAATALLLSCLTFPVLFGVAWLLFGRPLPSVLACLFLAVLPVHLRMAGSGALETGSLLFLLLLWLGLLMYRRERRPAWLYAAATAGAWLMNWRMENPVVLVPLALAVYLALDPERGRVLRSPHAWLALLGAYLLSAPGLVADLCGLARDFYLFYAPEDLRALQVRANLTGNLLYWVQGTIHPVYLTVLALAGAFAWRPRREALAWAAWVAVLQVFYSLTPSADFSVRHTLDSWRVALHPVLGVILLAAAGAEDLWRRASPFPWVARALAGAGLAAVLATPLLHGGFVHSRHPWIQEYLFLEGAGARLPDGCRLAVDGASGGLRVPDLRRAMLAYAARYPPGILVLEDRAFRNPGQGEPPQALLDLATWTSDVAGGRVFLYHVGRAGDGADAARLLWLHEFLRLRVVAGIAVPRGRVSFTLFEVEGLTPAGLRWTGQGS